MLSCSLSAMLRFILPLIFSLGPIAAEAGEVTSAYTKFDLDQCKVAEPGDEYVYEGTWTCPGFGGLDIVIAGADGRNFVGFGKDAANHCGFHKTFGPPNTSLSPVEWRVKDGKPFAAIERWSVVADENGYSNVRDEGAGIRQTGLRAPVFGRLAFEPVPVTRDELASRFAADFLSRRRPILLSATEVSKRDDKSGDEQ